MLESRLILNVTVLASEPLDDLSNRHTLEHGMRSPKALASPPASDDGAASLRRLLTPENNLVLVPSFDVVSICSLGRFNHDCCLLLLQFQASPGVSASSFVGPYTRKYIRLRPFLQSTESSHHRSANALLITQRACVARMERERNPGTLDYVSLHPGYVPRYSALSSDHSVCSNQHIRRNRHADLLRRFQVDDELEFISAFDRQIDGLSAFQDFVHEGRGTPTYVAD